MSRTKHVLWLSAIVFSLAVFVVSLWSDVWEAYLAIVVVISVLYAFLVWRSRSRL